jgi:hypothetical protein
MRSIIDMDNIQIEITNICHHTCSNCTRLIGHAKTFFMDFEFFKNAVDSMERYPKMVGIMGGEPLLHPEFEGFCDYLNSKIPPEKCGLWTCFPETKNKYREIIVKTFGNVFLNDHTRADILHHPILVSSQEIALDDWIKWYWIEKCWVQNSWSASINLNGAFFCEVAAALSTLQNENDGWEVNNDWWKKTPKDFIGQMEKYCVQCGCAMPLKKRNSTDSVDDISPEMFEKLKNKSPKIKLGKYEIHNLMLCNDNRQTATYKESEYRTKIADRYGIFLTLNDRGFNQPFLKKDWNSNIRKERE